MTKLLKGRISRRPWWTKNHTSCPSCGNRVNEYDGQTKIVLEITGPAMQTKTVKNSFKCSRCGVEMSMVDFWQFHHDKTSKQADLTNETEEESDFDI